MYAMDQTMHFEHSADAQRRTRWDVLRPTGRNTTTATTTTCASSAASTADVDASPTHEFLD